MAIILLAIISILFGEEILTSKRMVLEEDEIRIYNDARQEGFVITTGDESNPIVLGYSDTGYFDPNNIPPAMKAWMESMKQTINANGGVVSFPQISTRAEKKNISPLLGDIAWGQNAPYNNKCPLVDNVRSATGCSATANSMIMKYYQYPQSGIGSISYVTQSNKLSLSYNFAKNSFDWSNMISSYISADSEIGENEEASDNYNSNLVYCGMHTTGVSGGIVVRVDTLFNNANNIFSGTVQFMVYDSEDKFRCTAGTTMPLSSLKSGQGYQYITLMVTLPSNLPDGTYKLYLGAKKNVSNEWSKVYKANYSTGKLQTPVPFLAMKTGNSVTIGDYTCATQYTQKEADAVSELMYAAGVSMRMDYGADGSSAAISEQFSSLYKYFKYDHDMFICIANDYKTENCQQLIIDELETGRPVLISGITKDDEGHAFIADGLRYSDMGRPLFHINWGWDGVSNGYFALDNLNPDEVGTGASEGSNFSYTYYVIGGIKPEDNIDDAPSISYNALTTIGTTAKTGDRIKVTCKNFTNVSPFSTTCMPGLFLVDENGNETYIDSFDIIPGFKPLHYYASIQHTFTIPINIASGIYTLKVKAADTSDTTKYGRCMSVATTSITITNPNSIIEINEDDSETDKSAYDLFGRKTDERSKGIIIRNGKVIMNK